MQAPLELLACSGQVRRLRLRIVGSLLVCATAQPAGAAIDPATATLAALAPVAAVGAIWHAGNTAGHRRQAKCWYGWQNVHGACDGHTQTE